MKNVCACVQEVMFVEGKGLRRRRRRERATGLGTEQEEARVKSVEPVSGGSCVRELTMRLQQRPAPKPNVEETSKI